jgi:antitoxin (DNA-binding transcriptional repressor) of toxin-antitoxin stability system
MRGLDRSTAKRRTRATVLVVYREISQRELRNQSGEVMRALDAGESFIVTRNGVGVGELTPLRRRRFVDSTAVVEAFSNAAPIDAKRFRADVDRFASQDTLPRA